MVDERYATVEQNRYAVLTEGCSLPASLSGASKSTSSSKCDSESKGKSAEKARCFSSDNFSHFADFKELGEKYVARDASSYMQRNDRNAENQGTYPNLITPT